MGHSLVVLVLLTWALSTATAFVVLSPRRAVTPFRHSTQLKMTSSLTNKRDENLPPSPEDQLTLSGDVFSLFVYSFMDHSINDLYADAIQSSGVDSVKGLDPLNEFGLSGKLPVWFDAMHTMLQKDQLLTLLSVPHIDYAPALQTAGMASILLTSVWLACGYLSGAFLFRNTLECHTTRMLWVTGQTWLWTAASMVALALFSDAFCSHVLHQTTLGGLTKADADYIFDSLTVLITWRFMVSSLLGGFTKK